MNRKLKILFYIAIVMWLFLLFTGHLFAYNDFKDYINTIPQKQDDSQILRVYWNDTIGWDIFAPYYLEQDIENEIKTRISCSVFGFKGKSEFSYDCKEFRYTFHKRF